MTYYAFTAMYPKLAAEELRKHKYDAFCVEMMDRRRRHRHAVKGSAKEQKWEPKPIVALKGYVFVAKPNLWKISKLRYVGQAVRFCGRFKPIPDAEMNRVLSARHLYFRDDDPPLMVARKAPPLIQAGDVVRFTMAAETIEAPAMSTDGHTVLVKLRSMMLGTETMRVSIASVERVA